MDRLVDVIAAVLVVVVAIVLAPGRATHGVARTTAEVIRLGFGLIAVPVLSVGLLAASGLETGLVCLVAVLLSVIWAAQVVPRFVDQVRLAQTAFDQNARAALVLSRASLTALVLLAITGATIAALRLPSWVTLASSLATGFFYLIVSAKSVRSFKRKAEESSLAPEDRTLLRLVAMQQVASFWFGVQFLGIAMAGWGFDIFRGAGLADLPSGGALLSALGAAGGALAVLGLVMHYRAGHLYQEAFRRSLEEVAPSSGPSGGVEAS